ncbi:MAG TPA: hypothetical protein VGI40_03575 [Pirellulaceae bacterium]|jgi:hypothetical protein
MLRRRWLQFSLRFLFAATLAAAAVAWWFRPGVVKPEFSSERFSQEIDAGSGKREAVAHIRLANSGPDSIWLQDIYSCQFRFDEELPLVAYDDGRLSFGGIGFQSVIHPSSIRLKPKEFNTFAISIREGIRTIKIGVDVADRRKQRKQTYWSQAFPIPDDLFSERTP